MKFKEWDRVVINAEYGNIANKKATVLGVDDDGDYMLRFDENIGYHDCYGTCDVGHGFFVDPESSTVMTLITNKEA